MIDTALLGIFGNPTAFREKCTEIIPVINAEVALGKGAFSKTYTQNAQRKMEPTVDNSQPGARLAEPFEVPASDDEIFEKLSAWRLETARLHGVRTYTVFLDAELREIAKARPISLQELRGVTGMGAKKILSFGDEIVALVNECSHRADETLG